MDDENLPLSTADPKQPVRLRLGKSGFAAHPPSTVMVQFQKMVDKFGDKPALHQKVLKNGTPAAKTPWTTWTWKQYKAKVDSFAKSLISIGFEPFDAVNIIGFNAPEWLFANFGTIAAGGMAAGIYATNQSDACKYITTHSNAKVVVVEGVKQLDKFTQIASEISFVQAIVMYGQEPLPEGAKDSCPIPIYTFDSFLDLGKDVPDSDLKARIDAQKANQVCTLIYTSGTTGNPKAVMITHDNILWTIEDALRFAMRRPLTEKDCIVSFLPLSHIAAQTIDLFAPLFTGVQIYFAQPDALRGSLGVTLKEVRPTILFAVPRVWEKIYDKMQEVAKTVTGMKKVISTWAKGKASDHWDALQYGSRSASPFSYFLAQKILQKVHAALGLDRCIGCYTGAAPIEEKILKYFASIDLPVLELFGQSECTGPHTMNTPTAYKFGTCGRPLPGTESKIDEETGELCYRGRHIFAGYMGMEDKTTETIDSEGWLHSGDMAKFDEHNDPEIPPPSGFMSITGRIKELIITAGGENIPPVLIEEQFKLAMPALSNCMVIGDKRKFLSILLCLTVEVDEDGVPSDKLTGPALATSEEIGSDATATAEVMTCDKWKKYFDEGMEKANANAASRAQRVAKWTLMSTDFSEKGGELTPTLKLKRKVTAEKYHDIIEQIYA